MIAVNVALFYAIRKYRASGAPSRADSRRPHDPVPGRRRAHRFAAIVFIAGVVFTDKARRPRPPVTAASPPPRRMAAGDQATGHSGCGATTTPTAPSPITTGRPADTAIDLELLTTDVIHTWNVPTLPASATPSPARPRTSSSAPRRGRIHRSLGDALGPGLRGDGTEVEVVPADDYEAYIEQLKTDIESAQNGSSVISNTEKCHEREASPRSRSANTPPSSARAGSSSQPAPTTRTSADPDRRLAELPLLALLELLLMRLQLSIPDNTFLTPVTFNRMLSSYGRPRYSSSRSRCAGPLLLRGAAASAPAARRCRDSARSAWRSTPPPAPSSTAPTSSPLRRPASTRWRR